MRKARQLSMVILFVCLAVGLGTTGRTLARKGRVAQAADNLPLTGRVTSASGKKLEGVTVSAKADGSTIRTSIYTDDQGDYYFPPLPAGKYEVLAQAGGFENGRAEIEINDTVQHRDFVMKENADFTKQLTGDEWASALPEDTPEHRRMKDVFINYCTGCHPANFTLQNRFDENGWMAMLNLMSKNVDEFSRFGGIDTPPWPVINFYKKQLASYLAEMRGPGTSPMQFNARPRPKGDETLAIVTEYDIPIDMDGGYGVPVSDGSDWSLGAPSRQSGGHGLHDSQMDLNGNIWVAYTDPSNDRTLLKVDAKTGEVTSFRIEAPNGMAAMGHGIARDQAGMLWFNEGEESQGSRGDLAEIDPNTGKIQIFSPPNGMSGVGGNIDVDKNGNIWAVTETGATRFDPRTHEFREFKSPTLETADGETDTYGDTVDSEGNGWWTQMEAERVNKGDITTGKSTEIIMPPKPEYPSKGIVTDEERRLYELSAVESHNQAAPWSETPRRLAADKNGDLVWVCDFYGDNLAEINIHTLKVTLHQVPTHDSGPYAAVVDKDHNVWINLTQADKVDKFDPKSGKWTEYVLPTLGGATRHMAILQQNGKTEISLAYTRISKVARMQFRTKEELQALRQQVQETARRR